MDEYRRGGHSVFEIRLHLVETTRYRKPVLVGPVGLRLRKLIRETCRASDVHFLKGHVSKDHVHLLVSIPPQVAISRLMQRLKGKTAYKVLQEFLPLREQFWGRRLWAWGEVLLEQRHRDGPGDRGVHRRPGSGGGGFPRGAWRLLAHLGWGTFQPTWGGSP